MSLSKFTTFSEQPKTDSGEANGAIKITTRIGGFTAIASAVAW